MIVKLLKRLRWPKVALYGSRTRGDIKHVSILELERLTAVATNNPKWSANGRPEWLRKERANIRNLMLTVFGTEGRSVYRCLVLASLADESKCSFTLDVSTSDFDRLPDISFSDVVSLAHKYLASYPPLKLDPDQKASWHQF
jgi:hypothetical protein